MKATMRLYKQHDLDLISLYKNPEFSLEDVLITSLRAYLKQEPVCFYVPTLFPMDLEVTPRIVMLHINLDDDKDADIIDFIEKIREKYRNSFFKNIIRGSIVNCNFYPYMTDKENIKKSSLYIKSNLKDDFFISSIAALHANLEPLWLCVKKSPLCPSAIVQIKPSGILSISK